MSGHLCFERGKQFSESTKHNAYFEKKKLRTNVCGLKIHKGTTFKEAFA